MNIASHRPGRRLRTTTLLAILLTGAANFATAAEAADDAPPVRPGQVLWPEPTAAVVAPQTEEEKKEGMQVGRTRPVHELLQPDLDPALRPYVPTKGYKISRKFNAGCSDVLPDLVAGWVAAFRKYQPGFQLTCQRPLAGSLGALELIKGNLDLVFVSRELKPTDVSGFSAKFGYPPFSVPISGGSWRHFGYLDAMGFMVNPANPVRELTFQQLDAAFSTTRHRGGKEVKTWGDLGLTGEWASKPVHLFGIKPWNGFEEFIRQRVLSTPGHRGEWNAAAVHYDETFFALARRVANDPLALGYTGLSAVDSEVKIVPVSANGEPAQLPSYENVARATYPLSRLIYLNTNARSGAAMDPAMREFLRFILSREGQAVVRHDGVYMPLRANQVAASEAYVQGQ